MKRILVILLSAVLLSGCKSSDVVEHSSYIDSSQTLFERHTINGNYSILVDKETKVCYLEYKKQSGYA